MESKEVRISASIDNMREAIKQILKELNSKEDKRDILDNLYYNENPEPVKLR